MIESLPELVVVGDIELLFLGLALGAGSPRMARRILDRRYGTAVDGENDCPDCPTPEKCSEVGCQKEDE